MGFISHPIVEVPMVVLYQIAEQLKLDLQQLGIMLSIALIWKKVWILIHLIILFI